MPLTVYGANVIIVVICFLWLLSGSYKFKFHQIIDSKLLLASIVFFCLHVVGLLWTEDLYWGIHIVHKMWYFLLLLPVLSSIVRQDFIRHYITAFLLAITITEVFSYLIWFEIIEPFKNASIENPTPFMNHVSYNPILAIAIYLVMHELFFNKKITNFIYSLYFFFAISMSINMFITGGRAGQVVFFVMLSILIIQVLDKKRISAFITIIIVIPLIFFTAYQTSDLFQKRVNLGIKDITYYNNETRTSVGIRINYALNSWQVIKKNPIIGVGTGDFPFEYSKINKINSPKMPETQNPHNMYTLVQTQLGLLGLFSLLSIFYYQIQYANRSSSKFIRDVGVTLPLLFLVLMLSDSYLLGHFTTLVFIFFSAFLYKDFEKN